MAAWAGSIGLVTQDNVNSSYREGDEHSRTGSSYGRVASSRRGTDLCKGTLFEEAKWP
ncbi:hypothetical protein FOQG_06579 [Fusarium oxysporum f. sp. raphani 54005]|uniref:Uncharacterized protein n=4 Tax=Fusarium oxysporum TaxID=5507 RepID=X0CJQ5_FUSOX|nr:hypothetical protein FOVG_06291 [Fusarium oxysporum f. sp. pisi HDV247]EXK91069.1 hypothetical protein FOQG_06579 [Fusarium oxysporum f. sp. raphani 54005]EXL84757.1 hypothetical protein FOPG_03230 [Fusarium oxysporum f. sp. conglutinans race 2 54008]EXM32549.1 hypothetical protein FOTG_02871 [Fusarium oxysporum f. sp. vasinfectum 25433]